MKFYLGIDVSTQSCKGVVINEQLEIVYEARVHFDSELPEYKTTNGVYFGEGGRVTSPTQMWVDALKLLLQKLKATGCDMRQIIAISGSGQQHGSVYLRSNHFADLNNIQTDLLVDQSPVWMDHSTTKECQEMTDYLGGESEVRRITGSAATERFTAHHIAVFRKTRPQLFAQLQRISLVSSFGASLLCGRVVSIDRSDAAGMNLMDLTSSDWHEGICTFLGQDFGSIRPLLGPIAQSWDSAGVIDAYWSSKYDFCSDCQVIHWSGDNPCAIVGMGLLQLGDIVISLGTSDTCIFILPTPLPTSPLPQMGHLFPHPLLPDALVGMLVYANGDITRQKIRDRYANGDWQRFAQAMTQSSSSSSSSS